MQDRLGEMSMFDVLTCPARDHVRVDLASLSGSRGAARLPNRGEERDPVASLPGYWRLGPQAAEGKSSSRRACETNCHPTDLGGVGGRKS